MSGENISGKGVSASQRKQMEANSKPVNGFKRGNYYLFTFVTYYLYFLLRKREEGGVAEVSFKTNTKEQV